MTGKTKRQLRAEAVERLKEPRYENLSDYVYSMLGWGHEPHQAKEAKAGLIDLLTDDEPELTVRNEASDDELFRCSYCHCEVRDIGMTEGDCGYGLTFCPQCGGEIDEGDSRRIEAKLGEPTNGIDGEANGIDAGPPLVDEPPEGDALTELRNYENAVRYEYDPLDDAFVPDDRLSLLCGNAADMVERDYVRRDEHNQSMAELNGAICERDGRIRSYERRNTELNDALKAICEVFDVDTKWSAEDTANMVLEAADRDYVLRISFDAVCAERDKLLAENADDAEAINRLAAERDYWKQQVQRCMDAAHPPGHSPERRYAPEVMDYPTREGYTTPATLVSAEIDGLRDEWKAKAEQSNYGARRGNDGAKQGMTNLEWLMDEDPFFRAFCNWYAVERFHADDDVEAYEWLMAEHVDADGTCPDAMGQSSDAHSKHQSKGSVSLSDLYGTWSDDCGQGADMSENAPDRVRDDALASENGVSDGADCSNGANVSQVVEHAPGRVTNGGEMLDDTREKLEVDVRDHFWHNDWCRTGMVFGWLDRQAAITERECREYEDALREQHHERMDGLRAERDRYRDMCGRMLDLAHETRRIADACMPESGKDVM